VKRKIRKSRIRKSETRASWIGPPENRPSVFKALDLSIIPPVIIYINFKNSVLWLPQLNRKKASFWANIYTEMFDTPFR